MSEVHDWNRKMIEEFRANHGQLGGPFAGRTMLLLHHKGAKTGTERVNPLAYQPLDDGYAIFASKAGAPTNPDWYYNLIANPDATVGDRRRHDPGARPRRRRRRARAHLDQAEGEHPDVRGLRGEDRPPDPGDHPRTPLTLPTVCAPAGHMVPLARTRSSHCWRSWENTSWAPPASCSRSHLNVSR